MSTMHIFTKSHLDIPVFFRSGFLLSVFLVLLIASGCSQSGTIITNLGQGVPVAVGQTVSINDEPIKIKFDKVISDSRCATGVECIWQGEVNCRLEISYLNKTYTKIITQPGMTSDPSSTDFNDYAFQFKVQPFPEAGKTIKTVDYRLVLTVDKKSS